MNDQPAGNEIDTIFDHYTKPGSPGCALAVMKDGDIVCQRAYGLAHLEQGIPLTPATVFNIGSMSKQFTAFAIALLEAEGTLSLDDDIRDHLPEMHDFGHIIRVRHLVHHTSGLRCTFPGLLSLAGWRQGDVTTMEDAFGLLKAQRGLNFRPGDEFEYANANYILLALICERAGGRPFAALCRERIFEPLGMSSTVVLHSVTQVIPRRAGRYYDDGQGGWVNAVLADSVVGPTNVHSTVRDLARWDENFYTGRLGGPAVLARMERPGRLNDGTELDYAFGLEAGTAHVHRGWQMVEHGGEHGGHCAWMVRFPEVHLSVVVLFNHFLWEMRDYALRVADYFLEDRTPTDEPAAAGEAAAPIELSANQLATKAGKYYSPERAALRDVTYARGRLRYQGLDLVPVSENLFYFDLDPQTHVEFISAGDGTVTGIKTLTASGQYAYDRVEAVSRTPGVLAQYAGRYYSPELDVYWTLVAGDGHLVAQRRKYVDSKLTPLFHDAFSDDWGPLMGYPTTYLVVFDRDERDTISGLRVSGTRVRHLRFVKEREDQVAPA